MAAANLYNLQRFSELLAPYGKLESAEPPVYKFRLRWGIAMTVYANEIAGEYYFDEAQLALARAYVAQTMPDNDNGGRQ